MSRVCGGEGVQEEWWGERILLGGGFFSTLKGTLGEMVKKRKRNREVNLPIKGQRRAIATTQKKEEDKNQREFTGDEKKKNLGKEKSAICGCIGDGGGRGWWGGWNRKQQTRKL